MAVADERSTSESEKHTQLHPRALMRPCTHAAMRAADDDDATPDWPGPKAWPGGMCLISFFALCAFIQAGPVMGSYMGLFVAPFMAPFIG